MLFLFTRVNSWESSTHEVKHVIVFKHPSILSYTLWLERALKNSEKNLGCPPEPEEREAGCETELAGVLAEGHHTCKEGHRHRGKEGHHTCKEQRCP